MKKEIVIFPVLYLLTCLSVSAEKKEYDPVNQLVVVANHPGAVISKDIYGHFSEHLGACIYGGIWVGPDSRIPNTGGVRNDVLAALKELRIPNLRWPGGCFADTYHWKDGIGPPRDRASIVNIHWGRVTEDNSFGTHEFMKLTELLGCDAYINGNAGSGTVREMSEWIEYLTSDSDSPMTRLRKENGREYPWKVRYFAIGNENWGCGGNMTADYYSDVMRRFSTYLTNYGTNQLYRIACGPYGSDVAWTETLMKDPGARTMFQGMSIHYYSVLNGWDNKGSATDFTEGEWIETFRLNLGIDDIIRGHEAVMDQYDPEKKIGLVVDEWGNWFNVEPGTNPGFLYQQNTIRDAITAAIHLNIFNQHASRVIMANIAQMVNVLQSVILTKDDRMVLTPTYHVFRMFRVHQGSRLLTTDLNCEYYSFGDRKIPSVSASASVDSEGKVHISIANMNPNKAISLNCPVIGENYRKVTAEILTSDKINSFNSFEDPDNVRPVSFNGFSYRNGILEVEMPSKSVIVFELSK